MELETAINLFLTFVNVVSVWLISSSIDKHTAAMKIHREYLEKQNAAD